MIDRERIERIGAKLISLWNTQPNTRFGQLIFEIGFIDDHEREFFNFGDDRMEQIIDAALAATGLAPEAVACGGDVTDSGATIIHDEAAAQLPRLGYMRQAGAHMHNYDVVRTDID